MDLQALINSDFTYVFEIQRGTSNCDHETCVPTPLWGQQLNISGPNWKNEFAQTLNWISLF